MNTREWTGIILAGGLSSRMGTNKAMLELNGSVVLQHVTKAMRPAVSRIIVAAGPNVTTYSAMGYDCVQDHYPRKGPLAGLHAALEASDTDWNLVGACDMPLLQTSFFDGIKKLVESHNSYSAIVPRVDGHVHPLAGAYHKRVLLDLEQRLVQDHLRVMRWLEEIGCLYVETEELERAGVHQVAMQMSNMNTPEEYERIRNQDCGLDSDL
ncbi:molybdenum cofactor guanylyltransferase [Paenibacillus sp. W2I17]|uniref:molybdenum cofactor guanylyltransferase n=1 Tax=Paenibacillus sp. W2I17 TaxID=3042311 RepID=UPI00277E7718|nr:molybdenum cofactor guanylyltransferase [Paenibacillus sp. W2I17]MDQ0659882.1 molybdopterin-guanine dinucleotide biosynthesis protein A [Paenibacillus sp. W2I17]